MLLRSDPPLHLTYCTNIHPADGWEATFGTLRKIAPELKRRLAPATPFGLGLRLGARDARELLEGNRLTEFRAFLTGEGLYVALINGFPYGPFHGEAVKTNVYAPDWRTSDRVAYTLDLISILAALLPDGIDGGISTTPLSYKAWLPSPTPSDWELIAQNLLRVAERLVEVFDETGRRIHLDIEPEPDCTLETSSEAVEFFSRRFRPAAGRMLATRTGLTESDADDRLADHIRLCFDCCHCAVEFEDPIEALKRIDGAGVRVGRFQLSSALTVDFSTTGTESIASRLTPFAESTYLHQVVERCDAALTRFSDLDIALLTAAHPRSCRTREWRVHFHVPLFTSDYDHFGSSQNVVRAALNYVKTAPITSHLEIETYTWNVLPPGLKIDLIDSIEREYRWVLGEWDEQVGR